MKSLYSEKGAALSIVVMLVAVAALLIVMTTQEQANSLVLQNRGRLETKRNQVAHTLWTRLTDHDILLNSARADLNGGADDGNLAIANCIYPKGSGPCTPRAQGYKFKLSPAPWFAFNNDVPCDSVINSEGKTVSNPQNIHCFLSGSLNGSKVGYDLDGRVGIFSEDFPLLPETKVFPICKDAAPTCRLADALELRFTLTYYDFDKGSPKVGILGTYPAYDQVAKIDVSQLVANKCNPGAVLVQHGSSSSASDVCECRAPWKKKGENAQGPICELETYCQPGMVPKGLNSDGSVACVSLSTPPSLATGPFNICVGIGPGCDQIASVPEAKCDQVPGYVRDIQMKCSQQFLEIKRVDIALIEWLWLLFTAGPVAAAMYFSNGSPGLLRWVTKLVDAGRILTSPFGIMGKFVFLAYAAAVILPLLTLFRTWKLENPPKPQITCTYHVTCASLR